MEVESYPPNEGPYALYTKDDFYEHIDFLVDRVSKVVVFTKRRNTIVGFISCKYSNLTHKIWYRYIWKQIISLISSMRHLFPLWHHSLLISPMNIGG